jgi:hypothetical protein
MGSADSFAVPAEVAKTMCQEFHKGKPADVRPKAIEDCLAQMTIDPPARQLPDTREERLFPGLNVFQSFTGLFALIAVLYFVPAVVAFSRKKANRTAILVLNIFLGWTFIGWVIALVWAVMQDTHDNVAPKSPS